MEVIPVIDLKGGAVVRARLGLREFYAPITTPLATSSAPTEIVAGLLSLHPFATVYVADIDAIEGRDDQGEALKQLDEAFPQVNFWVDPGIRDAGAARSWLQRHPRAELVLGSESLASPVALEILRGEPRLILSLDYRGETLMGPEALLAQPRLWPARVIVMAFGRIGANAGPDLARSTAVKAVAPGRVYSAGGVRGPDDLAALNRAQIDGALVASALHDGQLTREDLAVDTMALARD